MQHQLPLAVDIAEVLEAAEGGAHELDATEAAECLVSRHPSAGVSLDDVVETIRELADETM
jgi:hypothetical protein